MESMDLSSSPPQKKIKNKNNLFGSLSLAIITTFDGPKRKKIKKEGI
jgi:hypothetical protein